MKKLELHIYSTWLQFPLTADQFIKSELMLMKVNPCITWPGRKRGKRRNGSEMPEIMFIESKYG